MISFNLYIDFGFINSFILHSCYSVSNYRKLKPKLRFICSITSFFIAILLAFIYANYLNYDKFFYDLIYINLVFLVLFSLSILLIIRKVLNERSRNNVSDAQTFINLIKKNKHLSKTELIELLEKLSPEDQHLLSDVLKEVETKHLSAAPKPHYDYDEVDLKVQEWADSEEGKARIKRLLDKDN